MTKTVTLPLEWSGDQEPILRVGDWCFGHVVRPHGGKFWAVQFGGNQTQHDTLAYAQRALEAAVLAMGVDPVAELSRTYQEKLIDAINDKRHFPEERAGFQMAAALFRSCLVQPPEQDPGKQAWADLLAAARRFEPHLDQFERVRWETDHGPVYLAMSRTDPYPESAEPVTPPANAGQGEQ